MTSALMPPVLPEGSQQYTRGMTTIHSLHKEFGLPFVLFDAQGPDLLAASDGFPLEASDASLVRFVQEVTSHRRAGLGEHGGGWKLLGLPIWRGGKPNRIAVGALPLLVECDPNDEAANGQGWSIEQMAVHAPAFLTRWAQAVSDRQRVLEDSRSKSRRCEWYVQQVDSARKTLDIVDRLVSQLKISDRKDKFPNLVLTSVFDSCSAACLAWVPAGPRDGILVVGQAAMSPERIRQMVLEAVAEQGSFLDRTILENRVPETTWGRDFPEVLSALIVAASTDKPCGWLVALNAESRFAPSDAAVMLPVTSLLNVYQKNFHLYVDLKELMFGVVRALTSAIDAKDRYTCGHSERVARIATRLGRQMKLTSDEISNLYIAGLLHDVGKIGVADHVLKKAGPLTPNEYRHVMSHVEVGASILSGLKRLRHVMPGILHHHERYDGGGHPDGLQGEAIPLIARILAVADSFDAMSSERPYRPRRQPEEVDEILRTGAGKQWDPTVVQAFFECREELSAIQQRGLGESLRIAVNDAIQSSRAPETLR